MRTFGELLENREAPKVRKRGANERGDLLGKLFTRLEKSWKGKKPLSLMYLAKKVKGFSLFDLYAYEKNCDEAERNGCNWAAIFWSGINKRNKKS